MSEPSVLPHCWCGWWRHLPSEGEGLVSRLERATHWLRWCQLGMILRGHLLCARSLAKQLFYVNGHLCLITSLSGKELLFPYFRDFLIWTNFPLPSQMLSPVEVSATGKCPYALSLFSEHFFHLLALRPECFLRTPFSHTPTDGSSGASLVV